MPLDSRRLQRRHNLRQTEAPQQLMHHNHAYWREINYTLLAGLTSYNSLTMQDLGSIVYLNPVVLMHAVKAQLVLTTKFPVCADSYTVQLCIGSHTYDYVYSDSVTYVNTIIDISEPMLAFFKVFREEEACVKVKVSNASNPVSFYGIYLRFTTYQEDTYGDYESPTNSMLINDSMVNKGYIKKLDAEAQSFEYISGIKPR